MFFTSRQEGLNSKDDETLKILLVNSFFLLAPLTTTLGIQAIWAKCEGSFMKGEPAFPMCVDVGGYLLVVCSLYIKNIFPDTYLIGYNMFVWQSGAHLCIISKSLWLIIVVGTVLEVLHTFIHLINDEISIKIIKEKG